MAEASGVRYPHGTPFSVRFWDGVDRRGADECWPWTRAKLPGCYGMIRRPPADGGSNASAHRIAWELSHGPIAAGLEVCHRCDNPPCCNPAHLFLGTSRDNQWDKRRKGRGNSVCRPRLTDAQVAEIRRMGRKGVGQTEMAALFGVTRSAIGQIVRRETWRWLGAIT